MRLHFLLFYSQKRSQLIFFLLLPLLGITLLSSCVSTRYTTYFKTLTKDTTLQGFITNDFESKIQKGDVLGITVSSMSKELDERFNMSFSAAGTTLVPGQQNPALGYLVNSKGAVTVHFAGDVKAEGLTRKELKEKLEQSLLPFMKEPLITVQYLNHKVTILGEVAQARVLNMPEEQLSLIDVIVSSGDIRENGKKNDILIIREENNQKIVKHINLEDNSIFSSPWYYIKPNDIVCVLPDNEKYVKEDKRRNLQTTIALVASVVSLIVIVLNVILK